MAYVFREGQVDEWEESILTYLIRTFWIIVLAVVIAIGVAILALVAVGEDGLAVAVIIFGIIGFGVFIMGSARTIYAFVYAIREKPVPRPTTWLI